MILFRIVVTIFLFLLPILTFGQRVTGFVKSAQTKLAIKEAIVSVKVGTSVKVTSPDSLGNFLLPSLSFGRFDIDVRCLGFQSSFYPQVLVTRGKDTFLEIFLQELPQDLDVVGDNWRTFSSSS